MIWVKPEDLRSGMIFRRSLWHGWQVCLLNRGRPSCSMDFVVIVLLDGEGTIRDYSYFSITDLELAER